MRCTFPQCFREAATKCATCHRVYCTRHCGDRVDEAGTRIPECDLCDPAVQRELAGPPRALTTLGDVASIMVFLAIVALGIAIDVSVRGQGFVALWVFVGAFVVIFAHVHP
ncbi:MAG TPA: hypothetical protein VII06_18840 [Chloroflexota bacterium]|jgi:hypothetical protein